MSNYTELLHQLKLVDAKDKDKVYEVLRTITFLMREDSAETKSAAQYQKEVTVGKLKITITYNHHV